MNKKQSIHGSRKATRRNRFVPTPSTLFLKIRHLSTFFAPFRSFVQRVFVELIINSRFFLDGNVDNLLLPIRAFGRHEAALRNGFHVRLALVLTLDERNLSRGNDGDQSADPPGQSGEAFMGAGSVQQTCDRRSDSATCGASTCGQAVDLAQDRRRWRGFLDEDEKKRVGEDGKEVADGETGVKGRVEQMLGQDDQVRHDEVSDGVADGDDDKEAPNPQPGGHQREYDGLDDQGDDAVDAEDQADLLDCHSQATGQRDAESLGVVGAMVLQEDGKQHIIGHAVVGEDTKSNDEHHDILRKDRVRDRGVGAVGLHGPGFFALDVNIVEGAVGLGCQVGGCVGRGTSSGHERRLGMRVLQVLGSAPGLHIRVSLLQEQIASNNGAEKHKSADQVWQEIGEPVEERTRGEESGEVLRGLGEVSANGGWGLSARHIHMLSRQYLRPTIVPTDQTKGMTAYARAGPTSAFLPLQEGVAGLTLMLGLVDNLANHGLDDTNVAVEDAAEGAADQGDPEVCGETDDQEREKRAGAAQQQDGLAANAVAQAAPVHAGEGLGEGEGRDEDARVEGGIVLVGGLVVQDQLPGIGEDGSEGNGLGNSDKCWRKGSARAAQKRRATYQAQRAARWETCSGREDIFSGG